MRTRILAVGLAAVAAFVMAGTAVADCGHAHAGKGHGACMGKGDCPVYDSAATMTLEGTVVAIEKEQCKGCNMTHVDLVVKMKDDEVTVRLGPAWYLDNQGEMLKKDDVVKVVASKIKYEDTDMYVAGKVSKGDDTLMLRDKDGLPMWQGWRRGKV